jgi:hypothetical protein
MSSLLVKGVSSALLSNSSHLTHFIAIFEAAHMIVTGQISAHAQ